MAALIDDPAAATPGWFDAVFAAAGLDGAAPKATHAEAIGDGQVARVFRVTVEYEGDRGARPRSVVLKMASDDARRRMTGAARQCHVKEVGFYQHLAARVPSAPRCDFAAVDAAGMAHTLVLADLAQARPGRQREGLSPAEAKAALEAIAEAHAVYWQQTPLTDAWLDTRTAARWPQVAQLFRGVLPAFLARFGPRLPPETAALCEALAAGFVDWRTRLADGPRTVVHADFRADNLLFTDTEAGPRATILDWQMTALDAAEVDVAGLIGGSLDVEARRAHEAALIDAWHAALCQRGVKGWDREAAHGRARLASLEGVAMAVIASMLVGHDARGEALFAVLAERHIRHALDHGGVALLATAR
ncbi:MAG: phosphotransferase [Myxococcales bacterium]|nr:phosphotransferase [Myxococcales bacterium]